MLKRTSLIILITSVMMLLSSCARHNIDRYQGNLPPFNPEEFFQGELIASGVLKNRSGEVTRYFTATIEASWQEGIGTLAERFEFDDGEIQYRTWTLTPTSEYQFEATAGDVIGTGSGEVSGNALHLNYVLEITYNRKPLQLNVDDWMWRVSQDTVINQSTLTKWGFVVGSIQLAIQKK
ncbi:DUF3833 domain-containing protein [Aestuariicella sp. G3-2]|uniref:DUF3833 domain-containing protein n=1 Tax=Pseudomaricurvus albidus TaxID=2842452 RepID=UPI001C0CA5D9|nr:DUF3833 domain-containing protein [Aestuariicella albida]MBU3070624.1 DUF3833 domain-containing protein [Aestuariicella albida]